MPLAPRELPEQQDQEYGSQEAEGDLALMRSNESPQKCVHDEGQKKKTSKQIQTHQDEKTPRCAVELHFGFDPRPL